MHFLLHLGGSMFGFLKIAVIVTLVTTAYPSVVEAHSGGLNAEGCHNDRKRGGYHCHRSDTRKEPTRSATPSNRGGAFRNCTAARAAGAAPVYRGDPGYGTHLDRDNDGIGCE
ncbi:excalibur calcium-binding domain-containing protein [Gemmobacter aquatilis]|uniref:excalibur calcium-binding domain-containing protein n=1 Tax=Gemmobacter aquatilis TaxID=933059 RepID=UPI0031845E91